MATRKPNTVTSLKIESKAAKFDLSTNDRKLGALVIVGAFLLLIVIFAPPVAEKIGGVVQRWAVSASAFSLLVITVAIAEPFVVEGRKPRAFPFLKRNLWATVATIAILSLLIALGDGGTAPTVASSFDNSTGTPTP